MTSDNDRFPRIKKGPLLVATKDGAPGEEMDRLLANSYMKRHVQEKPEYWRKLNEMLYSKGRLKVYAGAVEDIVDKFSFLMLARDEIAAHEKTKTLDRLFHIQYHVYSYVFFTKAFLDSIAVFLNEIYTLGFSGGQIDLKRQAFLSALRNTDPELAAIIDKMRSWIDYVIKYRDNLIHRHGLYIGPLPTMPEGMTDPAEQARHVLEERSYMPVDPSGILDKVIESGEGEYIRVSALVEEWLNESFRLFDSALRFFSVKFELVPRDTSPNKKSNNRVESDA